MKLTFLSAALLTVSTLSAGCEPPPDPAEDGDAAVAADAADAAGEVVWTESLEQAIVPGVSCTSATPGDYCTNDMIVGGAPNTLYHCNGVGPAVSGALCAAGCRIMDARHQDYCNLTSADLDRLMTAARAALGRWGDQCKVWVQNVWHRTFPAITVPTTAANGYSWNASPFTTALASWRATYAVSRTESRWLAANSTYSVAFNLPNADQYKVVLYGPASLQASVYNAANLRVAGPRAGSAGGELSSAFSGAGAYTLRVVNTSAAQQKLTAVVLSTSRFQADFETARRADVMQMYFNPAATFPGSSTTPHTAIVQTDRNAGALNWLDSNFCPRNCELVSEHTVGLDQMIKYTAGLSSYGFTVYRIR